MCGPPIFPGDHQRGHHHDRTVQRHQKLACGQDQQTNPLPAAASPAVTAATASSSGIAPAAPSARIFAKTSRPTPHDRTASRPPISTASIVHKSQPTSPGHDDPATPLKALTGYASQVARHDVSRAGDQAMAGCSEPGSGDARRASAIMARAQRRDVRPNIWASLRSESGLPAFTLSRYAATAA
jgi:hypothetical protein